MYLALVVLLLLTMILTYQYLVHPAMVIQRMRMGVGAREATTTTKESFGDAEPKARFVFLYMDGCGWCTRFRPVWDDLGSTYGKALLDAGVTLEDYESGRDESRKVAARVDGGVKGYPTIVLLQGASKAVTFQGDRTVPGLLEFLQENGIKVKEGFFEVQRVPSGADLQAAASSAAIKKNTPSEETQKELQQNAGSKQPNPY
jgi:hypothetical protein